MQQNPFTFGNPVRDHRRFFGRREEIRQVVNRLLSSAHESTSIVGERRIGKTSLVKHLADAQVAASLGLTPDRFCLIYIDFQGLTDITPQRFWQRVLSKMARTICVPDLVPEIEAVQKMPHFDLFDLEDLCERIAKTNLTTVLLLDEFEYVTQNANFGADFFGGLRALAIHHNLPLVTATRRELIDLCHSAELKGSPFFNIFANVVLRPFTHADALEMISAYLVETELDFTPQELEWVLRLGGGHPFFVQVAGYYLVEARQKGLASEELQEHLTSNFDQQADPHFTYLWAHCSESEKITLLAILSLTNQVTSKKVQSTLENIVKIHARARLDIPELIKRGLLLTEGTGGQAQFRLLSTSLVRWIAREIVAAPGSEESKSSVEEWLHAGGKDVVDPVKGALPRFKKKYWPMVSTILQELSFELTGAALFQILTKAVF